MRLLAPALGTFLILIGLGFIVLLIVVARSEGMPDHIGVPAFMAGFGVLLIWVGSSFLRPQPADARRPVQSLRPDLLLIKSRFIVKLLTAAGCGLVLVHIIAICLRITWPPGTLLSILNVGPVWTGLLTFRILEPGAFQAGLVSRERWDLWPSAVRFAFEWTLKIGWVGYIAVFLLLFRIDTLLFGGWHLMFDLVVSFLICIVYASQFLALRFGKTRDSHDEPTA